MRVQVDWRRGVGMRALIAGRCHRQRAARIDLHVYARDAVLHDTLDTQALAAGADGIQRGTDDIERHAEIDQRAEHHVAGRTARAIDVQVKSAQVHCAETIGARFIALQPEVHRTETIGRAETLAASLRYLLITR